MEIRIKVESGRGRDEYIVKGERPARFVAEQVADQFGYPLDGSAVYDFVYDGHVLAAQTPIGEQIEDGAELALAVMGRAV